VSAAGDTLDAVFVNVEVSPEAASDAELAAKLAEVCPVDIFTDAGGRVEIVAENLDECVLCELCINASPAGAVKVIKLYSGQSLPA
jgi:NAD-dependent dihydropyrimidine dehydrogenase PreA subunit